MKIFAIGRPHKKASLNLSINAIVIVVLAMTLLGLGLGFIRGQFKQITETTSTVQEQVKQQILDDLRTGNKKLSFPATRLTMGSSEKKDLAIGIKNTGDSELSYKIIIQERNEAGEFIDMEPTTNEDGTFFWDNTEQTLGVGESRVYGILHQAETTKDTYLYKLKIETVGTTTAAEYDSKSFFVTVV